MIDAGLKAFLEAAVAVVVGTRDAELTPETCRAWGPRVLADGRSVELLVDRAPAARTLANLAQNGLAAVNFVDDTYRAVQLKGRCAEAGEADTCDRERAERHHARYARALARFGLDPGISRLHWSTDVVKLRLSVAALFDQTPGPAAGRPL